MTTITLSSNTQALITTAVNNGPGANNQNYIAAYNAISAELKANGTFNSGTVNWFSGAGAVNAQATGNGTTAEGTYILNYMLAAAQKEGTTITASQVAAASNTIASTVFTQLRDAGFVFTDVNTPDATNFAPKSIVANDAGAGLASIKAANPGSNLDAAIWGASLFARTQLNDPTYFSDYNINLTPGSADCAAIAAGELAGERAVMLSPSLWLKAVLSVQYLDVDVLHACFTNGQLGGNGTTINFGSNGDTTFTLTNAVGATIVATIGANNSFGVINNGSTADIAGRGAIINISNASVTFAADSSAFINGSGNIVTVSGIPSFSLMTSTSTQVEVGANVIRAQPANGSLGTDYNFNALGQITSTTPGFIGFSLTGGFSTYAGVANTLLTSVNAAIPADAATGAVVNAWLTGVTVANLGSVPLGNLPFFVDPTGTVAGGLIIGSADIQVLFPTVNFNGVFYNSPSGILGGYYRPGAEALSDPSQNLSDVVGGAFASLPPSLTSYSYLASLGDYSTSSNFWVNIDPLLIDVAGTGVALTNWISNSVYFDTNVESDDASRRRPAASYELGCPGQRHSGARSQRRRQDQRHHRDPVGVFPGRPDARPLRRWACGFGLTRDSRRHDIFRRDLADRSENREILFQRNRRVAGRQSERGD